MPKASPPPPSAPSSTTPTNRQHELPTGSSNGCVKLVQAFKRLDRRPSRPEGMYIGCIRQRHQGLSCVTSNGRNTKESVMSETAGDVKKHATHAKPTATLPQQLRDIVADAVNRGASDI